MTEGNTRDVPPSDPQATEAASEAVTLPGSDAPPAPPAEPSSDEEAPAASEAATTPESEAATTPEVMSAAEAPAAVEAPASPSVEPAGAPPAGTDDDAEEVEPEVIESVTPKQASHHPPPAPSLRFKSAVSHTQGRAPPQPAAPRFVVAGRPKLVRDLMTRQIFTISPDDTLEHLEEHMQAFRFRHLPVVDGKKVVGLITHRDLLHASSSFLSERAKERDEIIHRVPAKRIMQRELITVRPSEQLSEVAIMMWEAKIGCVLVTEEDGTLLGIVTEADFIRLAHHFLVQTPPATT
jgi:CBS domain-containing membrane protein